MNKEQLERFLPIGTVVMLNGGKKRVMITGFCIVSDENNNKIYDYTGVMYPEGMIDSKKFLMFDHNQIEKIFHIGLVDEEEQNFKKILREAIEKTKEKNNKYETLDSSPLDIRISE